MKVDFRRVSYVRVIVADLPNSLKFIASKGRTIYFLNQANFDSNLNTNSRIFALNCET